MFPSCESGNTIAFAADGDQVDIGLDEFKASVQVLKKETGLNLLPMHARLELAGICANSRLIL
jgi:spermidine synthase